MTIKKLQTCKPDSVPRLLGVSAIYLIPKFAPGIRAAYPPCFPTEAGKCASNT